MMLCILAGTAAVTAAATNSGRYSHLREDQQKYLTVSSAVELMRDQFVGHDLVFEVTTTEKTESTDWPIPVSPTTTTSEVTYPEENPFQKNFLSSKLSKYFTDLYNHTVGGAGAPEGPVEFTFSIDLNDPDLETVKVDFSTDGFNLVMRFYLEDEANKKVYYTTMTLAASEPKIETSSPRETKEDTSTPNKIVTTTTWTNKVTITWPAETVVVFAEPSLTEKEAGT